MNTTTITAIARRSTIRSAAFAACLGLLFAAGTACGAENGTQRAGRQHAPSSADLAAAAKGNQSSYLQGLRAAARAEAAQKLEAEQAKASLGKHSGYPGPSDSNGYGDDHRQPQAPVNTHRAHAPGYNKALLSER